MLVGGTTVMGMGLPRRLASWKAVWSNQSSFSSAKYRMVLGKSLARAAGAKAAQWLPPAAKPKRSRPAPQRLTVAVVLESKTKQIDRWLYAFLLLRGPLAE